MGAGRRAAGRDGPVGRVRPRDAPSSTVDDVRGSCSERTTARRGHRRLEPARHPARHRRRSPTAVHDVGALLYVDGVHLTPHAPVDVAALGADFYACSPYKFFGPHHGIVVAGPDAAREASTRTSCCPPPTRCRSGSSSARCPTSCSPAPPPRSTSSPGSPPAPRTGAPGSWSRCAAVEEYEDRLFDRLLDGLRGIAGSRLHGSPDAAHADGVLLGRRPQPPRRCTSTSPTVGVNAPASSFYALEASRWIGLGDTGAVRAGLAPYTSHDDVERLLAGVAEVAREPDAACSSPAASRGIGARDRRGLRRSRGPGRGALRLVGEAAETVAASLARRGPRDRAGRPGRRRRGTPGGGLGRRAARAARRAGQQRRRLPRAPAADHVVRRVAGGLVADPGDQPHRRRERDVLRDPAPASRPAAARSSTCPAVVRSAASPTCPAYGASKAGMNAFGQSMALALAPHGISVGDGGARLRADRDGPRGPRRAGRRRRAGAVTVRPGRAPRGGRRCGALARLAGGAVLHAARSST